MGVGARIARGACDVVRRMDSPAALAAALAAVVGGDLAPAAPAGGGGDETAAVLLPLYPPGAPFAALLSLHLTHLYVAALAKDVLTWLGALVEQHAVMLDHCAEFTPSCFRSA